jgi:hypothetical protein
MNKLWKHFLKVQLLRFCIQKMYQNLLVAIIEVCIILMGPVKSIAFKEYLQLSNSCKYRICNYRIFTVIILSKMIINKNNS